MTRPQWLALAGILLASAVAAIAMAQWLTEKRLAERRVGLVNALGYTARALEEEGRASALGAAKLMGLNDPVLKAAALGVQAPDAAEVLQRLSIARALFDADGAYVIAGNGIVVAHSTEGVRSTGKDLAFRPYFKAAMRGAASSYAAVGSVTGERGLYYAAPLYRENRLASVVIGVVMLKLPGSKIDQLLRFAGDDVMLLSPQEIVFSATRAPWLLGMNPPVLESRVAAVRALHQFAGRFDQTAPVALPFDVNSESVAVAGQRHIVLRHKVEWGDPAGPWALVSLHDVDALVAPELRWMLGLGAFAILATLALLAAQVRLGRRHIAAGRARYSTLGTALALSPVSVVIADVDGVIDWVNPHFLQDTGYTWAQLKGQHTGLIVPPETQPEAYADMLSTVRAGKPWRGDFQNQRKDGSFFTAHTVVSPTFDAAGQVNGIVGLQEDTTQAMQLKAQLAEQIAFQSVLLDTIPIPVFTKTPRRVTWGATASFLSLLA